MLALLILISACTPTINKTDHVGQAAHKFFDMFKARNWQAFQDLYAEDMVFEDLIYRLKYDKNEFIKFYNWPDTTFSKHPDFPASLVLEGLALTNSSAIGKGYFNPFYYSSALFSFDHKWRFNISLSFDGQGKINHQIDFIEYPLVFLKNAAESLMDSVGRRD